MASNLLKERLNLTVAPFPNPPQHILSHFTILVEDLSMAMPFKEALYRLENRRVKSTRPLIPPQILQEDLPL